MNQEQLKTQFVGQLKAEYPEQEISSFFYLLTEAYMQMDRLQIALHPKVSLSHLQVEQFEKAIQRLEKHEPIQYIIGKTSFFGLDFNVNPNVLIPRPETEELVAWVLEEKNNEGSSPCEVLDIGTGSGCIAISLAKNFSNARVSALDFSKLALEIVAKNARENKVNLEIIQADILKTKSLSRNFDVIVSNPPYVRHLEKAEMQRNVLENEPASALYVDDNDALIFYLKIAELAKVHLKNKGAVYVECNQYLAKETESLFWEKGYETELRKDIFGNYRMLKATLIN